MEFRIVENQDWRRGGLFALVADGETVMVSDDRNVLLVYAGLLIAEQKTTV